MSFQNILYSTCQFTGGQNKDAKSVEESFFDPMNDLGPKKKLVDLIMFNETSVCRKSQNILNVVHPILSCIVGAEHTCHNVFKGWTSIEERTKLCREYKVC